MPLAREELVLLAVVLLALGLLALGLAELVWPRRRRRRSAAIAARPASDPTPDIGAAPRPPASPAAPSPTPSAVEDLIDQAMYLIDFPLRALVLLRRADEQLGRLQAERADLDPLEARLDAARAAVGCRLCESGLAEQAVAPLTQVVSRNRLAGEERRRAREALVSALDDIAEQRGEAIRRLAQDGNTSAAITHADRLLALLHGARDRGLSEAELSSALARTQRIFASLGVRRVVVAR